ncbi:MAG: hypothetical protein WDN49_02940 [Acetobacteraceae bacterium]
MTWLRAAPVLFAVAVLVVWEALVRLLAVPSYLVPGPVAILGAFVADPGAAAGLARLDAGGDGGLPGRSGGAGRRAGAGDGGESVGASGDPTLGGGAAGHACGGGGAAHHRLGGRPVRVAGGHVRRSWRSSRCFPARAAGLAAAPPELVDLLPAERRRAVVRRCGCCACPWPCRISWRGCAFPAGWRWWGAVVAEFVAGSGGFASGLAYRILEAGGTGCKSRACSPPWRCCRRRGWRSMPGWGRW